MLNANVSKLLNDQINKEMYSAYLYLDMANYYINNGLNGFGAWFNKQASEEMSHAVKFIHYLQDNNLAVTLDAIAKPSKVFKSHREPLVETLNHELFVTASINAIYLEAQKAQDFRTQEFLHWFIKEQNEEEKNSNDLIAQYDLFGGPGLFALDGKLGAARQ
jgi:ferritin